MASTYSDVSTSSEDVFRGLACLFVGAFPELLNVINRFALKISNVERGPS